MEEAHNTFAMLNIDITNTGSYLLCACVCVCVCVYVCVYVTDLLDRWTDFHLMWRLES